MPTETLRPTARDCPDPAAGGSACNSSTNTSATCTVVGQTTSVVTDSCRWRAFESPSNQNDWTAARLEVPWGIANQLADEADCQTNSVNIQYSTNGGSSWTSFPGFPKAASPSGGQSGTAQDGISTGVTVSQVRVRIVVQASSAPFNEDICAVTGSISDIRLEGDFTAPGTGACCEGESCSVTTQANCSGQYQGDGTDCSPNPCADPTGACCVGGSCSITTQAGCGGTYLGNGTDCSPNPCADPTGACCTSRTCSITTESSCTGGGGFYEGDSTICSPDPCPRSQWPVIIM